METFFNKSLNEIVKSINYLINYAINKKSTKIYSGVIISSNDNGTWNVTYNGETHALKSYGSISPEANMMVKVCIPQGNQNLAFFF